MLSNDFVFAVRTYGKDSARIVKAVTLESGDAATGKSAREPHAWTDINLPYWHYRRGQTNQ